MSYSPGSAFLSIGGVQFTLDDLPPSLSFDGEQLVAVRQYPGGGFNAQQLGAFDKPITLKGTLRWGNALARALALDRIRVGGQPVTMQAPGGIQRTVLLSVFQFTVYSVGTVDYDLTLQPVDPPGSMLGSIVSGSAGASTGGNTPATSAVAYTVRPGDTLWSLAAKFLGNGALWPAIYSANSLKTSVLQVGQALTIPAS